MQPIFFTAALWLGLAVLAAIIAHYLDISIALVEICVGIAAGAIADGFFGQGSLGNGEQWLQFLASAGAILLTFLAGAELDPGIMKRKMKEVSLVGIVGFAAPFIGATAAAYFILGWSFSSSLLSGIALSTTSMAVVYAVMVEMGLNKTEFGKGILGACFINDLGTVLALGLGALAYWSGSEAVLPAYVVGIVLAEFASVEEQWIRRLRTLTTGFLTPFYFIRAGSFVSVPALIAAPAVFVVLIVSKVGFKIFGLYPVISRFRKVRSERWYYTLMMSTGLTFGTISAMFGLSHGILTGGQYSGLVATVIASALVPTFIATKWFLPAKLVSAGHVPPKALRVSEGGLADE